jgi:hypothetical protein
MRDTVTDRTPQLQVRCNTLCNAACVVLRQLHELIQADFAKNHLKALKCFVEVDLLKCDRLLSQL